MLVFNTSTSSKRSLWPPEKADVWVFEAADSRIMLNDGLIYDDWCSSLGANTLGHGFFETEGFRFKAAASLPWNIERDFADEFCQAMGTEAVRFFKSGSDAVNCAVRLARAYTKRGHVIVFKNSYHGTGDWFGPNFWPPANKFTGGIVDRQHLIILPFGKTIPIINSGAIAAIVVEPVPKGIDLPPQRWLQHLREVCDEHGILLVGDQVILGYRHSLTGYPGSGDIRYDLLCYGKAMGQGAAISACTGRMDVMKLLEKEVHFSGTNNGEPLPLMIAQATLQEYMKEDRAGRNVCLILNHRGAALKYLLNTVGFETRGLNSRFEVVFDSPEQRMDATRFLWDRQILFPGFCSMAVTHTSDQMQRLVEGLKCWRESSS